MHVGGSSDGENETQRQNGSRKSVRRLTTRADHRGLPTNLHAGQGQPILAAGTGNTRRHNNPVQSERTRESVPYHPSQTPCHQLLEPGHAGWQKYIQRSRRRFKSVILHRQACPGGPFPGKTKKARISLNPPSPAHEQHLEWVA